MRTEYSSAVDRPQRSIKIGNKPSYVRPHLLTTLITRRSKYMAAVLYKIVAICVRGLPKVNFVG